MKTLKKYEGISIPLLTIILSLLAGAIVILLLDKNPIQAYHNLLQGSGILPKASYAARKNMLTDFMSFLNRLTPIIFASLAVAVAFKAGLFNIAVSSQMLFGGFLATILVGYSDLSAVVAKPLVIIIGIIGGALVGGFIGYLKYKYNINEVVSSIMVNYIIQYSISFIINTCYIDAMSRQSKAVSKAASLTLKKVEAFGLRMDVPLGILLAVAMVILTKILLDNTKLGYEIKTIGHSRKAAKYAGINDGKTLILAMLLSGALAGLAGVTFYLGYNNSIQPRVLSTVGFDGIAISLLGNSNPVGIFMSSFLINIIGKGSTYMSSKAGVPKELSAVITALILLFSACNVYIKYRFNKKENEKQETLSSVEEEA